MRNSKSKRVGVIGAGMAGVTAASRLARAGLDVTLMDKGRAPGGRLASLTANGLTFDFGAQYLTSRDPEFQAQVAHWVETNVAAQWSNARTIPGLRNPEQSRWLGTPTMRELVLGPLREETLLVRSKTEISSILKTRDGLLLKDTQGYEVGPFDGIAVTAPSVQTANIVEGLCPDLAEQARLITYTPTWAGVYAFDQSLLLPIASAYSVSEPIDWWARECKKPGRSPEERLVVHASEWWSLENLEAAADDVVIRLRELLEEQLSLRLPQPTFAKAHRWRLARPQNPIAVGTLSDARFPVVCGGDWTGGGARIESAWKAGRAIAKELASIVAEVS